MGIGERVVGTCSNPVKKAQLIKTTCLPKQCFVRKGEARAPSRPWMKEGLAQEVSMKEKLLKTSPSQAMP